MSKSIPARDGDEVWELTVPGRVHIEVTNHLGRPADATAAGKGSRVRLSTLDRQLAEEKARSVEYNPFRNGMLVQVVGTSEGDDSNALSDDAMIEIFNLDPQAFANLLGDLTELNVRRLKVMTGPADASASQIRAIDDTIAAKWPIGSSTPTYDEMMASPQ